MPAPETRPPLPQTFLALLRRDGRLIVALCDDRIEWTDELVRDADWVACSLLLPPVRGGWTKGRQGRIYEGTGPVEDYAVR